MPASVLLRHPSSVFVAAWAGGIFTSGNFCSGEAARCLKPGRKYAGSDFRFQTPAIFPARGRRRFERGGIFTQSTAHGWTRPYAVAAALTSPGKRKKTPFRPGGGGGGEKKKNKFWPGGARGLTKSLIPAYLRPRFETLPLAGTKIPKVKISQAPPGRLYQQDAGTLPAVLRQASPALT